jgi:hypothetical protein
LLVPNCARLYVLSANYPTRRWQRTNETYGLGFQSVRHWEPQLEGEVSYWEWRATDNELQLRPDQWPAIVDPDEQCDYPPDTGGGQWHPQAQALWRELERRAA